MEREPLSPNGEEQISSSPEQEKLESDLICFVKICETKDLNFFYSWKSLFTFRLVKKSFTSKTSCFPKSFLFLLLWKYLKFYYEQEL